MSRFKPGQSGNPGGRGKDAKKFADLCMKLSEDAISRIEDMAKSSEDDGVRLKANMYLVDRALGKPAQAVNVGDHEGGPLKVIVQIMTKVKSE